MKIRTYLLALVLFLLGNFSAQAQVVDYSNDKTYQTLYDAMHRTFNAGDTIKFFPAIKALQKYLLDKKDLHGYYTQRCNEIVFQMNQKKIYEAYKLARELSKELHEKNIEREMYMALNMLGHINRYCGNNQEAKENWFEVLRLQEKYGYYASMPTIYMNIVNVALDDSPEEADSLLELAKAISLKHCPERVFDIETRHTLSYFYRGEMDKFREGYEAYKKGVAEGKTSVHGREIEVYHESLLGNTDKAIEMARRDLADEGLDAITLIYEKAGRWEEFLLMAAVILFLTLLAAALFHIMQSRRRHLQQLKKAYEQVIESDKLKTDFIQNVSHEVRTPLNIISGFSQVISDPEFDADINERREIAKMTQKNTHLITTLIDEMLLLSLNESKDKAQKENQVDINELIRDLLQEAGANLSPQTKINFESELPNDFTILSNEYMLKIIINALLDNAEKNTPEGSITLKANRSSDEEITLIVEDTGCGIPANEAEHIFERFVKLDTFKEGIGLGLPLCRMLIEKLGGSINLDTTYTDGARFIVKLAI